jgi:hypothetical protein
MALFKHTYSGLITNGLGMPACCGMLTVGFHLFRCKIEVLEPPVVPGGGGGGGGMVVTQPGIYVPWKPKPKAPKLVQITVKMSNDKVWRKAYKVSDRQADKFVRVINFVNATTARIAVGVDQIKHASKRVVAIFSRDK